MTNHNELENLASEATTLAEPVMSVAPEFFSASDTELPLPVESLEVAPGQLIVCNSLTPRQVAETLSCLLGLYRPPRGQVRLFGEDLGQTTERRARRLRRRMGVCGGPLELDPDLSVASNLALPCQLKGLSRKQIHSRIERIAQTLEIEALLALKVRRLGFVERRAVSLARALAHDPELALLEAPLVGLPTALRATLIGVLQRLAVTGAAVVVFNEESDELETGAPSTPNDEMDIFSE